MPESLYIIDLFSLVFQVFHAIPEMTSPRGLPTNAVFGITRDVLNMLRLKQPTHLLCASDASGPGEREAWFPEYKANRSEMPQELRPQIPLIVETIRSFGIPLIEHPGWEADDIIATAVEQAASRDMDVAIVTNDKDARQLLSPRVRLYNVRKDQYLGEPELLADWGIRPDQVVDFQSLVGDSVDNVPGVPLVGPKKAGALIQQFGTLEEVLAHADEAPGAKLRENLKQFADQARLSRRLVTLRRDLPIAIDWNAARIGKWDIPRLTELFRDYGFRRFADEVRQLPGGDATVPSGSTAARADRPSAPSAPEKKRKKAETAGTFDFGDEPAGRDSILSEQFPDIEPAAETSDQPADAGSVGHETLPMPSAGPRQWQVNLVDTPAAFDAFLQQIRQQKTFCLDLETTNLDPLRADIVGWAISWQAGEGYYLAVRGPADQNKLDPQTVVDAMRPILENPAVEICNQNIKYDALVLRRAGIHIASIGIDPMVGHYLLDAGARSHSLDELSRRYFNHEMIPISSLIGKGLFQKRMDEVNIADVAKYAVEDAEVAWELCGIISKELRAEGLWDLYWNLERPLIEVLIEMQQNGIRVDAELLREQSSEAEKRLAGIRNEIFSIAGHEFNIDSPKQLQQVLFEELKLPKLRKTKTGSSTDQDVLEQLALQHPLPAKILEHRGLTKLKGTYLDALPQMINSDTGRIHCSFNQVVAATGRLSASEPNLQNIPIRTEEGQRVRRAFVSADSGWQLLCADYSQIELRILAHFCRDPALVAAFERGDDIHTSVAAEVYGVAPEAVDAEMRRVAKAVNFGVIYGQSPFGLSAMLGISQDAAAEFIDAYFTRFSGVDAYLERILKECVTTGYATTIRGRRRAIEGIRTQPQPNRQRNLPERTAINSVIQGSAADLIKQAMLNVQARLKREKSPGRLLLQIHDELVFEAPADQIPALAALVRDEMESAMKLDVPLKVDVSCGSNWLDLEPVALCGT